MSRSGYSDDGENLGLWRGTVRSAIRGKRGQKFFRELAEAMDAMPEKALIAHELVADGEHCALGVLGAKRGLDMTKLDPEDSYAVSETFNIADALAREVVYINDEYEDGHHYVDGKWVYTPETPEIRWKRVRKWVAEQIRDAAASSPTEGKP